MQYKKPRSSYKKQKNTATDSRNRKGRQRTGPSSSVTLFASAPSLLQREPHIAGIGLPLRRGVSPLDCAEEQRACAGAGSGEGGGAAEPSGGPGRRCRRRVPLEVEIFYKFSSCG